MYQDENIEILNLNIVSLLIMENNEMKSNVRFILSDDKQVGKITSSFSTLSSVGKYKGN